VVGGLGGALAFGVMAIRDAEIAIHAMNRSSFGQSKKCGLRFDNGII